MEEISRSCDKIDRPLDDEAVDLGDEDVEWRGLEEGVEARYLCRTDSSTGHESAEEGMGGWSGGNADEVMGFAGRPEELLVLLNEAGDTEPNVKETMMQLRKSVNAEMSSLTRLFMAATERGDRR